MMSANPRTGRITPEMFGRRPALLPWLALLMTIVAACAGSASGPTSSPEGLVDSGSWYVRVQWPHDGHPYESDRFVVYSDSASLDARRDVADRAQRIWAEIISAMSIDTELLGFPPGRDTIDIYAFKDRSPEWAGKAYYGGLVISSPDRRSLFGLARTDTERYDSTLKHELVHVVSEYLLHGGGLAEPPWVPVWFFEGLAEMISSGTGAGEIRGMDHLNDLTSNYGHLNPVSYQSDESVEGGPNAYTEYHYPMRQLAVEYLFDDDGYGKPASAATALLVEMADGTQFGTAFADHMGFTVAEYEEQFFELMNDYLPERSRSPVFTPFGLLLMSMITIGAATAVSVLSIRDSTGVITAQATTVRRSTRGTRIGFALWIAAVIALSLGMYVIGIYAVLGSWSLPATSKAFGAFILVLYLAAATMAVTWAIRSRRNQPWIAFLAPLFAFGAAAVAAAATITIL